MISASTRYLCLPKRGLYTPRPHVKLMRSQRQGRLHASFRNMTTPRPQIVSRYYSTSPNDTQQLYQTIIPELLDFQQWDEALDYVAKLEGNPEVAYTVPLFWKVVIYHNQGRYQEAIDAVLRSRDQITPEYRLPYGLSPVLLESGLRSLTSCVEKVDRKQVDPFVILFCARPPLPDDQVQRLLTELLNRVEEGSPEHVHALSALKTLEEKIDGRSHFEEHLEIFNQWPSSTTLDAMVLSLKTFHPGNDVQFFKTHLDDLREALEPEMMLHVYRYFAKILRAYDHFDEELQIYKYHLNDPVGTARALMDLGKFDEALTYFQQIPTSKTPQYMEIIRDVGICHEKLGHFDEAEELYDTVSRITPHDPLGKHLLGQLYYRRQDYKSAQELLDKAMELVAAYPKFGNSYPTEYELQLDYACVLKATESDPDMYLPHLNRAVSIAPLSARPAIYAELIDFLLKEQDYALSNVYARKFHEETPCGYSQYYLLVTYAGLGHRPEAEQCYETFAVGLNASQSIVVNQVMANMYLKRQEWTLCQSYIDRSKALEPTPSELATLLYLELSLVKAQSQFERMQDVARQIVEIEPSVLSYLNWMTAFYFANQPPGLARIYDLYLQFASQNNPTLTPSEVSSLFGLQCWMWSRLGQFEAVVEEYNKLIPQFLEVESPYFIDSRVPAAVVQANLQLNRAEEALERGKEFQHVFKLAKSKLEDPDFYQSLALAYFRTGNVEMANKTLVDGRSLCKDHTGFDKAYAIINGAPLDAK